MATVTTGEPELRRRTLDERLQAAGLPALGSSAWIEVDLDRLETNARLVRRLMPGGSRLGIVVKANGYGHGLEMSARAAVAGGADWLVVATLDEACRLREAGIDQPLLAIYPVPAAGLDQAAEIRLDVVVGDEASVRAVLAAGVARAKLDRAPSADRPVGTERPRGADRPIRVHLEIDTGMTRGGVPTADAAAVARGLASGPGVSLEGIWSHLRSPDDRAASAVQVERFKTALAAIERSGVNAPLRHLVSSDGLLGATCPAFDLARIGYAFYGGTDTARPPAGTATEVAAALRPALALKARAVRLVEVPAGTEVGYGGTWRAERPSLIATLPIGYADGWSRSSSPGAVALVRGRRVPLVGRVSMDAIGLDVTEAGRITPDDEIVLIGRQGALEIPAAEPAAVRGSIAREALAALGPRLPRVYLRDDRPVAIASLPPARITLARDA